MENSDNSSSSKNNMYKSKFAKFLSERKEHNIFAFGTILIKVIALFILLYLFMLSITLMGSAFKLFGKDFAHQLIATTSNVSE